MLDSLDTPEQTLTLATLPPILSTLSENEWLLLMIISIMNIQLGRTALIKCLQKLDVWTPKGIRYNANTIDVPLSRLADLSLIENGNYPTSKSVVANWVLKLSDLNAITTVLDAIENQEKSKQPITAKSIRMGEVVIRKVRLAFFFSDTETFQHFYFAAQEEEYPQKQRARHGITRFIKEITEHPALGTLPDAIRLSALKETLIDATTHLKPCDNDFEYALNTCRKSDTLMAEYRPILAIQLIYRARFEEAEHFLADADDYSDVLLKGWLAFIRGQHDLAVSYYVCAEEMDDQTVTYDLVHYASFFYMAELLRSDTDASLSHCKALFPRYSNVDNKVVGIFDKAVRLRSQPGYQLPAHYDYYDHAKPISDLLRAVGSVWFNQQDSVCDSLYIQLKDIKKAGYVWFAGEIADMLQANPHYAESEKDFQTAITNAESLGVNTHLRTVLQKKTAWHRVLKKLRQFTPDAPPKAPKAVKTKSATTRLVWLLTVSGGHCKLTPKEQSKNRSTWTKGRPVALKRLKDDHINIKCLTPQDIEVAKKISAETEYFRGYANTSYSLASNDVISLLIDHPYIFFEDDLNTPVELVNTAPELRVTHNKTSVRLAFYPKTNGQDAVVIEQESATRVLIYHLNANHSSIAKTLLKPVTIPRADEKQVHQVIDHLKGVMTIQSDISSGHVSADKETQADSTPHIQLRTQGEGLKMLLRIRPLGKTGGPYVKPGVGGKTVMAMLNGSNTQTNRDLAEEQRLATALVQRCPTLIEADNGTWEWVLSESDAALNLLLELQSLQDQAIVSWQDEPPMTLTAPISVNAMTYCVKHKNGWFETSGQLELDDQDSLALEKLLDLVEASPGRFIPLGKQRFLVLTDLFRQHLQHLNAYAHRTAKTTKIHPLAAMALGDFTEGAKDSKTDKHWKAHLQRIKSGDDLRPVVPSTFQGSLRDYQELGFQWLSRLAHWQVGACLADDMGLGKTIQALSFLLSRAHEGPLLVVAPTSVTLNWLQEISRLAPTLKPQLLMGNHRQERVENLQPFDLLICSYALLVQEKDLLENVSWQVVVLDEAQAIKNAGTKRSQAAMALSSEFKMILTGTPIENHLGELWNLFQFINPGLLGSLKQFNQRFAIPIEQHQDHAKRRALKALIQPFMLRRLKSQVLQELPAKTDITLEVALSTEEAALYEAIRQEAVNKLKQADQSSHIQILAEITRLRRMCCHPSLVLPEKAIEASKLTLLGEVLQELLENQHKALVFSQFVDHLSIVADYLDKQNIAYQYLDGKTSTNERRKRIDAFQSGQGSVFLISLKAGGTGLNLTAADYVLHLDPWWNPAVEDQASDRAHRIGQQRPVTVYHFITKNTIEEKIVALHQAKRGLAEDLLSGSHLTGKMSSQELLKLIEL